MKIIVGFCGIIAYTNEVNVDLSSIFLEVLFWTTTLR